MSITTSTLLYRPSLSIWTARKKDKTESLKVNKAAGAVDGAANVNKQLLPDSPELEAIQKWATMFRSWVYTSTLPWDDSGARIGRVDRHMDFMAEAGDKMAQGDALVQKFVAGYDAAVARAQFQLSNMFDMSDYPSAQEVERKFKFALDVSTLPNVDDFRVIEGVDPVEVERLVEVGKHSVETRIAAAMADAHDRLYQVVYKMATTLQAYGDKTIKKFNDTLLGNIADLVAVMPALNLTGDPKLTALTDAATLLAAYDLADLRKNDAVRAAAVKDAMSVINLFKGNAEEAIGAVLLTKADEARAEGFASPDDVAALITKLAPEVKTTVTPENTAAFDAADFGSMFGGDDD